MLVVIAGGHGKIALLLTELLDERGDRVRSLIRNPDHRDDVTEAGAEPVLCDLENEGVDRIAEAIGGADAVVFAAGACPGSGAGRKDSMDYEGAAKLMDAAAEDGIDRYVMVSAISADAAHEGEEVWDVYVRAKGRADDRLAASGLDHTIVRPGRLSDQPATGLVSATPPGQGEYGEIPRADVAAVIAAVLDERSTVGKTFDVVSGETPIERAVSSL
ncbi:MAG: SDR family oxidoreductase [Solirubrobacterales bacterium]